MEFTFLFSIFHKDKLIFLKYLITQNKQWSNILFSYERIKEKKKVVFRFVCVLFYSIKNRIVSNDCLKSGNWYLHSLTPLNLEV